jgi:hypothetical protein
MRSVVDQNVVMRRILVVQDFLDCLPLKDRTDRLSRNVGTQLPLYAA